MTALSTAEGLIEAPLLYKGKVRELYDLGEHYLIVVTDRISAFDHILSPAVPDKGNVLNTLSKFWFEKTSHLIPNQVIHTDVNQLEGVLATPKSKELLKNRIMVARKAQRIDIECVVRGYVTGGGWRQYLKTGEINGHKLPAGLRKNEQLAHPLFTPAAKNDRGHDEDISIEQMERLIGQQQAAELQSKSLELYAYARDYCKQRGIILADCKFEFGIIDGRVTLIDELFTPDCSRFWDQANYALDIEIDSMDKEPVRTYLSSTDWDKNSPPPELPAHVVNETAARYQHIMQRLMK